MTEPRIQSYRRAVKPWLLAALAWAALAAAIIVGMAGYQYQRLTADLDQQATVLHRVASQRTDQHDAHLTALSAITASDGALNRPVFLEVAQTVRRFYPRIIDIDLVPLAPGEPATSTRVSVSPDMAALIRSAARRSSGNLVIQASPTDDGRYLLIKRSPNTDQARFGLALEIDAAALLASDNPFWAARTTTRALALPDGAPLLGTSANQAISFTKPLGSASQPLILTAGMTPGLAEILPPGPLVVAVFLMTLAGAGALVILGQIRRRRLAERLAGLSAHEAQLAHAARVNAMGEMASGMAHELTQPLTALLSQAQAGLRMAERDGAPRLAEVMRDMIAQSRRAASILDRLRDWSKPTRRPATACGLNAAVGRVTALIARDAAAAGVAVTEQLDASDPWVTADHVELEQVIFNLARNAVTAAGTRPGGEITLRTRVQDGGALLELSDNGPGVDEALRDRIFHPFVTGRTDGTGLGLALSSRLVERMGGDLELAASGDTGACFHVRLPLVAARPVAARPAKVAE